MELASGICMQTLGCKERIWMRYTILYTHMYGGVAWHANHSFQSPVKKSILRKRMQQMISLLPVKGRIQLCFANQKRAFAQLSAAISPEHFAAKE